MKKGNNTKRSLVMSILVLVLCCSMLIGGTFAWFTDSASTSNNKIQAGTLDVDLLMANPGTGTYASIAGVDAAIFGANSLTAQNDPTATLWEPGKTQIVYLAVDNKESNLDLKYVVQLDVVDGGLVGALEYAIIDGAKYGEITAASWAELKATAQAGDVAAGTVFAAPNGAIKADEGMEYFALAIHMKESAGSEYQGKNITIDVTVLATQLASEADAFGNIYDEEADDLFVIDAAAGKYMATSEKGLSAAAKLATADASITSVTYVTADGTVEAPIVRDTAALQDLINAKSTVVVLAAGEFQPDLYPNAIANDTLTIVGAGADTKLRFKSQQVRIDLFDELTISNCAIDRMYTKNWGHLVFCASKTTGGVFTLSDCIFNGVGTQGIFINQDFKGASHTPATFNVVNCVFNGDFGGEGAITVSNGDGANFTLNVTGCEFKNVPDGHVIYVQYAYNGWTLNAPGVDTFWKTNP